MGIIKLKCDLCGALSTASIKSQGKEGKWLYLCPKCWAIIHPDWQNYTCGQCQESTAYLLATGSLAVLCIPDDEKSSISNDLWCRKRQVYVRRDCPNCGPDFLLRENLNGDE